MVRLCRLIDALRLAALIGLALAWAASTSRAAEPIVVETRSGRAFSGQIDIRTSPKVLVLRTGVRGVTIARPIDWNYIVRVRVDGKPLTSAQMLREFETRGWPRTNEELPEPPATLPKPTQLPGPSEESSEEASESVPESSQAYSPVRSLHIEASVAKWTSGVDTDGVLLRVYPLDGEGNIVPVSGTLEVDLIGQEYATLTRGEPFPQWARWGQLLDAGNVGPNGATFRLPFQAYYPDVNLQLGGWGSVHARLSVPGQGVFDDTATMVRTRAYDATRDRLQQFRGTRFFQQERTSRGTVDSKYAP